MNKLDNLDLKQTLPCSISGDIDIQALSEAISKQLMDVSKKTGRLLILPNLEQLPEAVVDQLAWHFSVDFYDVTLPRSTKEQLLYQSIAWHRRKGTVKVVEEMVTAIHNNCRVVENWDYGGEPYHFKIVVEGEPIVDPVVLDNLIRSVDAVKNVRSWLDGIEYERALTCGVYMGGATHIHREVTIHE